MPSLVLTLSIVDESNNPISGFPIIRRLNPTQTLPFDSAQIAVNGSSYANAPNTGAITEDLQCFVLTADQQLQVKFNNNGALTLSPGSVLCIFASDLESSPFCQINNATSTTANATGLAAGT